MSSYQIHIISSECYVNNVYIYGQRVTLFYIDTLLCFKQYIYILNNQLAGADMEGILTSLYMTLTNAVTVPPNRLQMVIAGVMIYIASNCTIANVYNLSCRKNGNEGHSSLTIIIIIDHHHSLSSSFTIIIDYHQH